MAALDILEIIRKTLAAGDMSDDDANDTYIPTGEAIFEAITKEDVTIAAQTTGTLAWDVAIAYLAIATYYTVVKELHMVGPEDDRIPAYVWWEQSAFRYMVSIGYSEYFDFDGNRGMYNVKGKNARAADMMAVKNMAGDEDVI